MCTVTGWGLTEEGASFFSDILQKVTIPLISNEECKKDYGWSKVLPSMMCAGYKSGGRDSCQVKRRFFFIGELKLKIFRETLVDL